MSRVALVSSASCHGLHTTASTDCQWAGGTVAAGRWLTSVLAAEQQTATASGQQGPATALGSPGMCYSRMRGTGWGCTAACDRQSSAWIEQPRGVPICLPGCCGPYNFILREWNRHGMDAGGKGCSVLVRDH